MFGHKRIIPSLSRFPKHGHPRTGLGRGAERVSKQPSSQPNGYQGGKFKTLELRCLAGGGRGSFAGCDRALACSISFNVVGRRCFFRRSRNASSANSWIVDIRSLARRSSACRDSPSTETGHTRWRYPSIAAADTTTSPSTSSARDYPSAPAAISFIAMASA